MSEPGCSGAGPATPEHGGYEGCELILDRALIAAGWTWRCNVDPHRAAEIVETYEALGFAVRLESINLDRLGAACAPCAPLLRQASAVYVRKD